MSMSVSASSNALSYLQQLLHLGSSGIGIASSDPLQSLIAGDDSGSGQTDSTTAIGSDGGSSPAFDPGMLAALISLQDQSATGPAEQPPSNLFAQLDSDGDGQIGKTEFENALGKDGVDTQSADALFSKLDANDDGSISESELAKAGHGHHRHHMHASGEAQDGGGQDMTSSLLSGTGADGATTQTTNNPDGSTTTTITYADGSTVETTAPAASQNSGGSSSGNTGNPSNANLLEQLIQLQSRLLTAAGSTLSTVA